LIIDNSSIEDIDQATVAMIALEQYY